MASNLSDFRGGLFKIGDAMLCEERGESFPRGAETWLRTGVYETAATYPTAAQLDWMKVIGLSATLPSSVTVLDAISNGSNTIVAAYGDATNVLVSTDGGASWNAVAHNAAGAVYSVAYGAGVFVAMGNSTTAFQPSTSPDGATWTVRTGSTVTTATANTPRVIFAGSQFVAVCGGTSATGQVSTSPDGITWTARNGSQAITAPVRIAHNGTIYLVLGGTTAAMSSTNGTSWTNRTSPLALVGDMAANSTLFVITGPSNPTSYHTSTDAITFTTRFLPTNATVSQPRGFRAGTIVRYTGTYFLITSTSDGSVGGNPTLYYSANGISNWKRRWLSAAHAVNNDAQWLVIGSGNRIIALPSADNSAVAASTSALYSTDFPNNADYVGSPLIYSASGAAGAPTMYLRVA
jgi:hypothetical protein